MPVFGNLLPARLPVSSGAVFNVASLSALTAALNTVADGSIINISSAINGAGAEYVISRRASSAAPVTITANPGIAVTNFSQWTVLGAYLRFRDLELSGFGGAGLKPTSGGAGTADHIDIDHCHIHNTARQGILITSNASNIQVWNNKIHNNGSAINNNLDHGVYWGYARGSCVLANNLFYDNYAYNVQIYPDSPGVIIACNTMDGGAVRGGMVVGSEAGQTDNVIIVGLIGTNGPYYCIQPYDPTGGDTGNNAYDSLGFGNTLGDFGSGGGFTYTNCTHADPLYVNRSGKDYHLQSGSPAIGKIQAARYGYVPALDRDGIARVTADSGCYAFISGSPPPSATTAAPSSVTGSGAQLNGTVNPQGAATNYSFQYGTTALYGSTTTPASAGGGAAPVAVNTTIGGLTAGTAYHYRVVAVSANGTTYGADQIFSTTGTIPITNTSPPTISGSAAVGNRISCSTGTWTGSPTSYSYQWRRETGVGTGVYADIVAATSSTYLCVAGDVGRHLVCAVNAT